MGRWSGPVTYITAVWIVAETINIAWPRNLNNGVWYLNWGIILMSVVLGIIGLVMCNRIFRNPVHQTGAANASVPDVERTDYNIGT
jgi:hypothetical protein